MADLFAIRVAAWRAFVVQITTGPEALRLLKWSAALGDLRGARFPQRLSPLATFGWAEPLLTEEDLALLAPDVIPDLADKGLARALRRVLLGTATHTLTTWEPRLSATLGITIPDAQLLQNDEDRAQWDLVVNTWVYPKHEAPEDLWFLADVDAYCGLASPEVLGDILDRDRRTGLFRRVAEYYCGEGGEFTAVHRFLELARVQGLWVYFNEAAT